MTRLRGRSPRAARCVASAPHGHWIDHHLHCCSALRCGAITAPMVIDGPMNGATFLAYVRTFLCPTLGPAWIGFRLEQVPFDPDLASHHPFPTWEMELAAAPSLAAVDGDHEISIVCALGCSCGLFGRDVKPRSPTSQYKGWRCGSNFNRAFGSHVSGRTAWPSLQSVVDAQYARQTLAGNLTIMERIPQQRFWVVGMTDNEEWGQSGS